MGLTLITGRANSGKTEHVVDALRRAALAGSAATVVLPSEPDARRLAKVVSQIAPVGLRAIAYDRWLTESWKAFGDGRRIVGTAARRAMVRELIAEGELRGSGALSESPGAVALLAEALRRAFEERASTGKRPAISAPDVRLDRLWGSYAKTLAERSMVEPSEAWQVLGRAWRPEGMVVFHHFPRLSAAQEEGVTSLASRCELLVTLTWEEGFSATEHATPLAQRLKSLAEHHVHVAWRGGVSVLELEELVEALHSGGRVKPRGAVTLQVAESPEAQSALVVERVQELLRADIAADRIAVVAGRSGRALARAEEALRAAGIAAQRDDVSPAKTADLGAAVGEIARFLRSGERAALEALLARPSAGVEPQVGQQVVARWRSRMATDPAALLSDARAAGAGADRCLRAARNVFRGDRLSVGTNEWKVLLDALLANVLDSTRTPSSEKEFCGRAHGAMLKALIEVESACEGRLDPWLAAGAALDASVSLAAEESEGAVQVTTVGRARTRRFEALVLVDATAGGLVLSEDGEGKRALLAGLGVSLDDEAGQRRAASYDLVTRARTSLTLIRAAVGADGVRVSPSPLWEDIADAYGGCDALEFGRDEEVSPEIAGRSRRVSAEDAQEKPPRAPVRTSPLCAAALDAQAIEDLGSRNRFRVTELESYIACPLRWFWESALRARPLDAEGGPILRGSVAHRALARFYRELPDRLGVRRVTPEGLSEALGFLDEVLGSELVQEGLELRDRLEMERVRREVRDRIAYDATFAEGFEPLTVEHGFEVDGLVGKDIVITGRIDRIDCAESAAIVIDYKSSETPSRAQIDTRKLLQAPLYAAVTEAAIGRPVVASLYVSLRSGAARGLWNREAWPQAGLAPNDALDANEMRASMERAISIAKEAVEGIRSGDIDPRRALSPTCDRCPARVACSEAQA